MSSRSIISIFCMCLLLLCVFRFFLTTLISFTIQFQICVRCYISGLILFCLKCLHMFFFTSIVRVFVCFWLLLCAVNCCVYVCVFVVPVLSIWFVCVVYCPAFVFLFFLSFPCLLVLILFP